MKVLLLNSSIITAEGTYELKDITLSEAKTLIEKQELDSAVGHQSTADVMTTLLAIKVGVDRKQIIQEAGQIALVFKLNGRVEEGKILSIEEIEKIGYKFQRLIRIK